MLTNKEFSRLTDCPVEFHNRELDEFGLFTVEFEGADRKSHDLWSLSPKWVVVEEVEVTPHKSVEELSAFYAKNMFHLTVPKSDASPFGEDDPPDEWFEFFHG